MKEFRYNSALDGIRGIALLLVILFHFGAMAGGWIGVEIFFVLSGYLISSILIQTRELNFRRYLYRFYGRRALRIFPPYFLYLISAGLIFLFFGEPREIGEAALGLFSFTYNLTWRGNAVPPTDFFIHFWSLCVEEQFYLVWPFFIYFCPRRLLRPLLAVLIVLAPLIRFKLGVFFGEGLSPLAAGRSIYFFPLSHVDALAAGGFLAASDIKSAPSERLISSFSILAALVFGLHYAVVVLSGGQWQSALDFGVPEAMPVGCRHIFGISLVVLGASGLIAWAARLGEGASFINQRALVRFGRVSYVGYILHLPIQHLMRQAWPVPPGSPWLLVQLVLLLTMVFGTAELSFRYFESPILALKRKFG